MNTAVVEQIAKAVLYEGYILYPYRASALKNQHRWPIGGLVPASGDGSEPSVMQTQCLVQTDGEATLSASVRFLHTLERRIGRLSEPLSDWPADGEPTFHSVDALHVGDHLFQTWEEAVEREVPSHGLRLNELVGGERRTRFTFPAHRILEPLRTPRGPIIGVVERRRYGIAGSVKLSADYVNERLFRVTVRIVNETPLAAAGDDLNARSFVSPHTVLGVRGGEFVSMLDPPESLRLLAADCRNVGTWPVLVGEPGSRDTMLSSPIILYDYPRVAPESPGDFFDGTEIDELLALRILTLTSDEKRQMRAADGRANALLDRIEALDESQLARLHGAKRTEARGQRTEKTAYLSSVLCPLSPIRPGDRVRLCPRSRADAFDMLLAGTSATVLSIEQDYEGTTFLAVTVDDDPGRDLGDEGKPGHRFFFRPDEVELLPASAETSQ